MNLDDLQNMFQRLDCRLAEAIDLAQTVYGTEAATDPYRGLYVSEMDVERLLNREPGIPLFAIEQPHTEQPGFSSRLYLLQQQFNLADFDLDLLLIALAPEIDRRYERLYAYLQDDVTRKYPSVDLTFNLLCDSAADRLSRRDRFSATAPLICNALIHLIPDPQDLSPSLLNHYLRLDEQIVQFLLGGQLNLDRRIAPFCQIVEPVVVLADLPLDITVKQTLHQIATDVKSTQQSLKLYLRGVAGVGKQQTAAAFATTLQIPLLTMDLMQVVHQKADFQQILQLVLRTLKLYSAVLYLPGVDRLIGQEQGVYYQQLLSALANTSGTIVLAGNQAWEPITPERASVREIVLGMPDFQQRQICWQTHLDSRQVSLKSSSVDVLADRFRLTPAQIQAAVTVACQNSSPTPTTFFAAARKQAGQNLHTLTEKIEARYTWDDIVLPIDPLAQLREICSRVEHRQVVYQQWGFDRKLSLGKGLNALFSGSSGTGKTMAAEVIATELQLDLYRIDLSQVVSKYIGETEKNLDRIFQAAESANAILFFDEADALFGKRSEVKDAHDRYANIEIGYLLQKVETYSGLAILATNLRQNLDDAFVRRLQFIIEFPFPDEEYRRQIWSVLFPANAPLDPKIDFELLAREIRLPGGNLKNIALASAFYAAAAGGEIQMTHLVKAAQREYHKVGRTWQLPETDSI
jgi:ATP-dependent 26S proteasome regulatory subunit